LVEWNYTKLLQNGTDQQREEAARKLGERKDPLGVEPLVKAMLEDPYHRVRRRAAEALGVIAEPSAVNALSKVFEQEDDEGKGQWIINKAIRSLEQIGTLEALWALIPTLEKYPSKAACEVRDTVRKLQADGKGEELKKPEVFGELVRILGESPDKNARNNAAYVLGFIGDPRALKPLLADLEKTDRVHYSVDSVPQAIMRIKGPKTITEIHKAVYDGMITFEQGSKLIDKTKGALSTDNGVVHASTKPEGMESLFKDLPLFDDMVPAKRMIKA